MISGTFEARAASARFSRHFWRPAQKIPAMFGSVRTQVERAANYAANANDTNKNPLPTEDTKFLLHEELQKNGQVLVRLFTTDRSPHLQLIICKIIWLDKMSYIRDLCSGCILLNFLSSCIACWILNSEERVYFRMFKICYFSEPWRVERKAKVKHPAGIFCRQNNDRFWITFLLILRLFFEGLVLFISSMSRKFPIWWKSRFICWN